MGTLIGLGLGIGLFCCYWACWEPEPRTPRRRLRAVDELQDELRRAGLGGVGLWMFALCSLGCSLAVLALYALSWWKTWRGLSGQPMAARQAALLTLAKIPNLLGMLTYHQRRRKGEDMRIIEYK